MRDEVRRALSITRSSTLADRTIDITTTGRRSQTERRIEICFYRVGDEIFLSGIPALRQRHWLANLAAEPRFVFHLKGHVVIDLPAVAALVVDPDERRRVLTDIVGDFNARNGPDSLWPHADLDEWVLHSPLARIHFTDQA